MHHYLGGLAGQFAEPDVLWKIPYMEMKLRLPEHLLMRVDKLTMAHSVEARVPYLDHDVVEFAMRIPPSYKLKNGSAKAILKKAAEPYIDNDMVYRIKQGFGAPMDAGFGSQNSAGDALPPSKAQGSRRKDISTTSSFWKCCAIR